MSLIQCSFHLTNFEFFWLGTLMSYNLYLFIYYLYFNLFLIKNLKKNGKK